MGFFEDLFSFDLFETTADKEYSIVVKSKKEVESFKWGQCHGSALCGICGGFLIGIRHPNDYDCKCKK